MALLVGWALIGGFGDGWLSDRRLASDDGSISIEYQKFVRRDAPVELQLTTASYDQDAELDLHLNGEFVEGTKVEAFVPTPTAVQLDSEGTVLTFSINPGVEPRRIVLEYKAKHVGRLHGIVQVNEQPALSFEQFVYP